MVIMMATVIKMIMTMIMMTVKMRMTQVPDQEDEQRGEAGEHP